jgi:hypothetical protein
MGLMARDIQVQELTESDLEDLVRAAADDGREGRMVRCPDPTALRDFLRHLGDPLSDVGDRLHESSPLRPGRP